MNWMFRGIAGTGSLLSLLLSGCAVPRFGVQTYQSALRLEAEPVNPRGRVGDSVEVQEVLKNVSMGPVEGCLSEGKGYNLYVPGGQARGMAQTIDHPGCVKRFRLEPGETFQWAEQIKVIDVGVGSGKLNVWVVVSDPTRCDKYGCDAVNIRSEFVAFEVMNSGS
jgi:hypothetical protein